MRHLLGRLVYGRMSIDRILSRKYIYRIHGGDVSDYLKHKLKLRDDRPLV